MSSTLASTLTAQTAAARVLIGGGTATDLRGVRSGAYAVAPSVQWLPDPHVALNLGARGTRFSNSEWSLGGSLGGIFRIHVRGGLALLLTGSGDAITTSYRVNYFLAEALPALEWSRGSLSLWGGARGAVGRTVFEPTLLSRARPPTPRSLLGPAFGGRIRLASFGSSGTMELSYREEHGRPDGTLVADRTTGLALSDGRITLNGTLGARRAADERVTFGSAQLVARVTPAISLVATAERYPSNPLTDALGGRAFTAGILLSLGRAVRPASLPPPAGIPAPKTELTRLSIAAPDASQVEVAGDWSDWRPMALRRSANGVWYVDLAIPPGNYRYAFRINRKSWKLPKGVAAVDDGFGGRSAWLTVP